MDLADLTRDAWTLLPGPDDFLAEVRTKRFDTLTYAHAASEPEDITLFERRRHKNIAVYASKDKLAARGRFYNEDDLAPYDVLDYDIDVTSLPDRPWLDGRVRMRLKVRDATLGQFTIRLADALTVRSLTSDRFGRMFYLRVSNQNQLLVNLPTVMQRGDEITLTFLYAGRLTPQSPDRETVAVAQDDGASPFGRNPADILSDPAAPQVEPSFLYSNRSYWYPQSLVSDYATARIRLTVPLEFGCVASGELTSPPEVQVGKTPAEGRHIYRFTAVRPARYLSFIVSRFLPVARVQVHFAQSVLHPPEDSGLAPDAGASLALGIDANSRQTRQGKSQIGRAHV